jgi:hypothetical protein
MIRYKRTKTEKGSRDRDQLAYDLSGSNPHWRRTCAA